MEKVLCSQPSWGLGAGSKVIPVTRSALRCYFEPVLAPKFAEAARKLRGSYAEAESSLACPHPAHADGYQRLLDCRTRAAAKEKMFECPDAQTNQILPTILHNQSQSISINAKSICRFHEELAFAEAPRKQNQLTNHPRKLKLWWRKQRGRPRGRQVRL